MTGFGRLFASALVLCAGPAFAEPVPPAPPSPPALIAVVNVQEVIHKSNAGKALDAQYDKQHQAFAEAVDRQERDLDDQEQDLNRQRTILKPDAFNALRQKLENHSAEVQSQIQESSQANQLAFNDAFAKLVHTIHDTVSAVAKEKGFTIVMPQEQVLYLGDPALDITATVLARVDEKLPSIIVSAPKMPDSDLPKIPQGTEEPPK